MAVHGGPAAPSSNIGRGAVARAFFASLSGTALEWYDFAIYSVASAVVLGPLFFPSHDPLAGTMLAFSTYAVGYIARPLGGIFFGRLGDRVGRKKVLVSTLVLIGAATFLIGLLPTHASIGPTAAVLLVILRFAQGVGVGGEWGGAVLLSSEFGDPRKRGFYASAAQIGPPAGNLMANGVLAFLGLALSEEQFLDWGWRVAFLLSGVLVLFGLWIRARLEETPVFKALEAKGARPAAPVREVLTQQTRPLIAAILSRVAPDVVYAMFTVFVITYATQVLDLATGTVLSAVLIGSAFQVALIPLSGWLSDKVNRRLLYGIGAVGAAVWSCVFFPLIGSGSFTVLAIGVSVGLLTHSVMYGPQAAFVAEQFHPRLRSTGSSLAYTLAGMIGGAVAPLLFTYLLATFDSWIPLVGYIGFTVLVTLAGLLLGRNPAHHEDEEVGAGTSGAALR